MAFSIAFCKTGSDALPHSKFKKASSSVRVRQNLWSGPGRGCTVLDSHCCCQKPCDRQVESRTVERVEKKWMRWFRHLIRMPPGCLLMEGTPDMSKNPGMSIKGIIYPIRPGTTSRSPRMHQRMMWRRTYVLLCWAGWLELIKRRV